jgi:hypothetical protein
MFISCNAFSDQDKKYGSPKGYKLTEPVRYRVRESMQEISGIWLHPDPQHIYAINDEEGKIFLINLDANEPYPVTKFGKSGDYEDLVYTSEGWVVLKSNGTLYHVHDAFTDSVSSTSYKFQHPGKQEFESAYYEAGSNSIVFICKQCEEDKRQMATSAYRFNMGSKEFDTVPAYRLSVADIARLAGTEMKNFRPAAAAIHPVEKRLYIVSSVNELLVIAGFDGKVQEVYHLKDKLFRQPEGISFAPNGDMYISNEAGDGTANILKFSYKP